MNKNVHRLHKHITIVSSVMLMLLVGVWYGFAFVEHTDPSEAASCTIDAKLVNSCRPWLGAAAGSYPGVGSTQNQILAHESRIGRKVDIAHMYHPVGNRPLSAENKYFVNRANTILSVTWKPGGDSWASAGGGDAAVNAAIDATADDFKSMGSTKIMLTLAHEPEDDVSGGASGCTTYKGTAGTPADYRAMWHNVRNRFDAKGVTNVVWVMNYMGFSTWDCMIDDLWPGNSYVDWVMWDPYTENGDFNGLISRFYNWLNSNSSSNYAYTSKPWGIAEWGSWHNATQASTYNLYQGAKAAVEANTFPRLKAYIIFDYGATTRIHYDKDGNTDSVELNAYKTFANSATFSEPTTTPPSTPPGTPPSSSGGSNNNPGPGTPANPSPAAGSPNNVTATTGQVVVSADTQTELNGGLVVLDPQNVTDPERIKNIQKVEYYEGGKLIQTVTEPPFALDSSKLNPGSHSITERVYFKDGTQSERSQVLSVQNTTTQVPPEKKSISPRMIIGSSIAGLAGLSTLIYFTRGMWLSVWSRLFGKNNVPPSTGGFPTQIIYPGAPKT